MDIVQRTEGSAAAAGIVHRAGEDDPGMKGKRHTIIGVLMVAAIFLLAL